MGIKWEPPSTEELERRKPAPVEPVKKPSTKKAKE